MAQRNFLLHYMTDDTKNKRLQKTIFVTSLVILILGIITIVSSGHTELFKFRNIFSQPLQVSQQPLFILIIFAIIALILSGRNLKKIKSNDKE